MSPARELLLHSWLQFRENDPSYDGDPVTFDFAGSYIKQRAKFTRTFIGTKLFSCSLDVSYNSTETSPKCFLNVFHILKISNCNNNPDSEVAPGIFQKGADSSNERARMLLAVFIIKGL